MGVMSALALGPLQVATPVVLAPMAGICLLYTSDAADE